MVCLLIGRGYYNFDSIFKSSFIKGKAYSSTKFNLT